MKTFEPNNRQMGSKYEERFCIATRDPRPHVFARWPLSTVANVILSYSFPAPRIVRAQPSTSTMSQKETFRPHSENPFGFALQIAPPSQQRCNGWLATLPTRLPL